jgi:hypothetical protein
VEGVVQGRVGARSWGVLSCDADLSGGRVEMEAPPSLMDAHVVVAAQQQEIFDPGGAAVLPFVQVVGAVQSSRTFVTCS